jgi:uncharacterized protein DUF6794
MKRYSPKTLDEAVGIIMDVLTSEQKEELKSKSESDLGDFHFTFGMWIRNNLIYGNKYALKLGQSMNENSDEFILVHPDDISDLIMKAVWMALQGGNRAAT